MVVGVSGGADSSALLGAMAELPADCRPRIVAAHFDHRLRGPAAADRDAQAVQGLCSRMGVPVVLGRAGDSGGRGSPEAVARQARYAFLADVVLERGAAAVAVGHHRDDRVETALLRFLRGSGSAGVSGIRPRRALAGASGPVGVLVRPLWFADRALVLSYLKERGLSWAEDESNRDLRRPRNLLRHVVLPALDSGLGVGFRAVVLRTADNLAADEAALSAWAGEAAGRHLRDGVLDLSADWEALPSAIRHRVLQAWWSGATGAPRMSRRHAEGLLRLRRGGGLDLPGGRRAVRLRMGLRLCGQAVPTAALDGVQLALSTPGAVSVPGLGRVTSRVVDRLDAVGWAQLGSGGGMAAAGDADSVRLPLLVRAPRPGERMQPLGEPARRPIREILRSAGVPPEARRELRIVADARGDVLWIAGLRQAAAFALEPTSRRALLLELIASGAAPS